MKGEVRSGTTVWILSIVTCGLYMFYWWYTVGTELKNYLGKEDLNPVLDLVIGLICGLYLLYLPIKYGALIAEAQRKSGIAAEDQGIKYLLFYFLCWWHLSLMQEDLNKAWAGGGGEGAGAPPASF